MALPPKVTDLITTTLLVTNIHCPSCVSYAQDVLAPFSHAVHKIDTSIIEHTIRVQHVGDISDALAKELIKAAFEVEHVTVTDSRGNDVRNFDVQPPTTGLQMGFFDRLFMSKAQRIHLDNCKACQDLRHRNKFFRKSWSDVLRLRKLRHSSTRWDVESGTLESNSKRPGVNATLSNHGSDKDRPIHTRIAILTIEGMTCASCVSAVTRELQQLQYVRSVDVNLVANSAKVTFIGPHQRADDIREAIEDIGYGAELQEVRSVEPNTQTQETFKAALAIEGMTCGSCVGTVTRALQPLHFLQSVDIDLVNNSATIVFNGRHNLETILETITDSGYDAVLVTIDQLNTASLVSRPHEREVQLQISGMYCPKCPSNMILSLNDAFSEAVTVIKEPTLIDPRMTVLYRPSTSQLTIRRIIDVINATDPACSASVYHPPSLEERSRAIQRKERNRILRHLVTAFIIAIPSFIIGVVYMSLVPEENRTRQWFEEPIWAGNAMRIDWALFIITTPAMFYSASIFHKRALKEIWTLWRPRSKVPLLRRFYKFGSMNLLISAGTSVAYFASLAVLIMDATSPRKEQGMERKSSTYFDTVTFLTLFILIGRFLEAYSKAKTGDAVSMLASLRPSTAFLIESNFSNDGKAENSTIKQVSVDLLEIGDLVNIPHGACPPVDGEISQDGNFLFDESSLTGESRPVRKSMNDRIFTGSINVGDPVKMRVTEIGGKSMLDQIVNIVREGQARRAPIERLADTLTGYFTPVITFLAISTWIVWLALGESGSLPVGWLDVDKGSWPYWSVEFAIAVFVVACPCGIGLAAPTALFVGGGLAAKNGILVQGGGEAFQDASKIDTIVFDKTGTLTEGRMRVTEVEHFKNQPDLEKQVVILLAKTLEEASTHPIAKAVVQYCDSELDLNQPFGVRATNIQEIPGQGMLGQFEVQFDSKVKSYNVVIGNERILSSADTNGSQLNFNEIGMSHIDAFLSTTLSRLRSYGNSTAILAIREETSPSDNQIGYAPLAVFAITDPIRAEAFSIIPALRAQGLGIHMCTGDNQETARSIASQLAIPPSNIRAGVLPQDKAAYIQELQSSAGARKTVAFVGDGTNDTPALTVSDVSIAISHTEGGGSDIALTSSSFVLLNSDLGSILTLVKLSKRVFLRVKLNFIWAAIYNICLIPVAAGVFFPIGATWGDSAHGGFRLSPVWASVAMAGSSVSVVLSSLALRLPEIETGRLFTSRRNR